MRSMDEIVGGEKSKLGGVSDLYLDYERLVPRKQEQRWHSRASPNG